MALAEFKEAVNSTVNKLINRINQHPYLKKEKKPQYAQPFLDLQGTITHIKAFPHIMTFYRQLFLQLEAMGKYADERSKAKIAQGAQTKIEALLSESFEYIEQHLNTVNDELLVNADIPLYFKELCVNLKVFFRNRISDQENLFTVYQLTVWLVKNDPQKVMLMIQNKRTIITAARSGEDKVAENAQKKLNSQISQANDMTSREELNENVPVNYIKGQFFSSNNNISKHTLQLKRAEMQQIDLIVPLLLPQ
ncbi:MAG: hypothetical protein HKM04_06390 [Legionellales bacterium]|nr:hypothetical protein [Legionellales bacterium]